eukprot:CAMPEP_0183309902 /NCGR_PEP_ID=MMETSP0160_2-20130417/26876_1 /TAXON_ID=2839 ORGANISM="Odontella Sinensis, Strain Grunow 1884" /NCGR_SAMPLE_ID=MMETSP0160_2 /ASSEMBLY_ACC=CAM_ASM_000250 /LENGTH=35 /DNA_ID= /DNA_START= /DNA_END= /DNA_ORIENTATION=
MGKEGENDRAMRGISEVDEGETEKGGDQEKGVAMG